MKKFRPLGALKWANTVEVYDMIVAIAVFSAVKRPFLLSSPASSTAISSGFARMVTAIAGIIATVTTTTAAVATATTAAAATVANCLGLDKRIHIVTWQVDLLDL